MRLVHTFGAVPQRGGGGGRGGFGGGRGGPGGGRAGVSNLNVAIHYRHADNTRANPLPSLGGTAKSTRVGHPGRLLVHEGRPDARAAVRLQSPARRDDEPVCE